MSETPPPGQPWDQPGQPPRQPVQPPYGPPQPNAYGAPPPYGAFAPQDHPKAILVLILGIVGLVVCGVVASWRRSRG